MAPLCRLACLAALLGGCGSGAAGPAVGSSGSTILRLDGQLWLTSPDDDAVVVVDPDSLEVISRFDVAGEPQLLAALDGAVWVTLRQAAEVARIADGAVARFAVPCGGTSGIAAFDGHVVVACPNDARWARLTSRGEPAGLIRTPFSGPIRVGLLVDDRAVLAHADGHVGLFEWPPATQDAWPDAPEPAFPETSDRVAPGLFPALSASRVEGLAVEPETGGFAVAFTLSDSAGALLEPSAPPGGYGRVVEEAARIEPRVYADCAQRYVRFDGGVRAQSGPSAVAWQGDLLWIAHRDTDSVSVHRCAARPFDRFWAPNARPLATLAVFRVGRGPRGLALSPNGRTAWVDVGFDHAVARLELAHAPANPLARYAEPAAVLRRSTEGSRWSAPAERGRRLFFDAVNTHLTPSGVVTCGTCHPGGGQDGLTWRLHTAGIPAKRRRTPPAWAGRPTLAPYHWDGEFGDAAALATTTIRELMEGDALLVDVDAIAAYMAEVSPPFPRPVSDPAQVARGREVFATARCATCHSSDTLQDGLRHRVLSTPGHLGLEEVHTPTLIGVRARPPYLHDGRAPTLRAVLVEANPDDTHGVTSDLSDSDIDALVAYLESL